MTSVEELCEQLRALGRRVTPQRRAIIQVILEHESHLTADMVFTYVRRTMPDTMNDISPATIYNTLHELVEVGMLKELDLGLGERCYDVVISDHAHLVCLGCGRVEDVACDDDLLELTPDQTCGFDVLGCTIIYRGYCPACVSNEEAQRGLE